MPPKKKVRLPSRAASTPPGDVVQQAEKEKPAPIKESLGTDSVVSNAWTDEQETSLFKSMIRWKPVGTLDRLNYMVDYTEFIARHAQALSDDIYL